MKTVIEMAREATLLDSRDDWNSVPDEYREAINAFAELVRAEAVAKERNSWPAEMEAMERQVNILTDALAQAKAEEREACAKVCEDLDAWNEDDPGGSAAKAIRARGQA